MKRLSFIIVVVGGLLYCSIGRANIIYLEYADDGDGAITCPTNTWSQTPTSTLSLDINKGQSVPQYWGPGHINGTITTDSTNDPTLTLSSSISNDTSFAWTSYEVNVYMNYSFTLSAASVTSPTNWTVTSSIPITAGPVVSPHGSYEASIVFTGGTPVAIGDNLDFGYTISFSGATSFAFCQELVPIPEPGIFSFLAIGAFLLGGALAAGRRNRHS